MTNSINKTRRVVKIVTGTDTQDGAGVQLTRVLPASGLPMLDPFLLLDAFHSDDPKDYIAGFPPHPHRGFETVTYLLAGRMRHRDSAGHNGIVKAGGVQWMTAGRGIEHSEMPEQEDGLLKGFQLWINLPAAQKMAEPRYQELEPEEIPEEHHKSGTKLRVIAGTTTQGTQGVVNNIAADPVFFDVSMPAGANHIESIPTTHNAFILILSGAVRVRDAEGNTSNVASNQLAVLQEGNCVQLETDTESRFLLVAGRPMNEPIARHGPFVMNTSEEIEQAYRDYNDGLFGHVEEAQHAVA
jgi:redox-sensitive bicupin YhaK (pirin superfamily)